MSRRRRSPQPPTAGSVATRSAGGAASGFRGSPPAAGWLISVVAVLVTARYFLPAESAALGETLWIVQFWLISGVVWLWMAARDGRPPRRFDGLDLGVWLMVAGPVVSATMVVLTGGERRAAINMLWEWIGMGVSLMMVRHVLASPAGRDRMLSMIVISAITLAGLGIWQHHVWYPALGEKLGEFDRLSEPDAATEADAGSRADRLRSLRRELGPLADTADGSASQLLRARVASSTEPIGRFALANTFAGLLLVGLIIAMGAWLIWPADDAARQSWWSWGLMGVGCVALADCLWLTKSRTATVGLFVALGVALVAWRRRARWSSGLRRWVVGLCTLLVGLPLVAVLSGSLDREVITEAPKSLQYRWEYWTATGAVLRENPVWGVGPGNFRQAYLRHKLIGSSEEILDPHNLFLDVWVNGGLLALAGLLTVLWVVARHVFGHTGQRSWHRPSADDDATDGATDGVDWSVEFRWRVGVGVAAIGLAALVELLNGTGFGSGGWWLVAGWCVASLVWPLSSGVVPHAGIVAIAFVGITVHLMGAGGIAMPAIWQTLLILAACCVGSTAPQELRDVQGAALAGDGNLPWWPMGRVAACLCLAIACAFSATLPVSHSRTAIQLGRALLSEGRGPQPAMRQFEAAIELDPFSAEGWHELAVAHLVDWQRTAGRDDAAFARAVSAQTEAIQRDPRAANGWQFLGDIWWQRYDREQNLEFAPAALEAYRESAARYPNHAGLQAKLAKAARVTGDRVMAEVAARHALAVDQANRAQGHADKYLSTTDAEMVRGIAEEAGAGI